SKHKSVSTFPPQRHLFAPTVMPAGLPFPICASDSLQSAFWLPCCNRSSDFMRSINANAPNQPMQPTAGLGAMTSSQHVYEVRPCKDKRGVDLISDVLPFGRLWYGEPDDAVGYAQFYSRSHNAEIRVYDAAGNVIVTNEHAGDFMCSFVYLE